MDKIIPTIGYACGIAARNPSTALGPIIMQNSKYLVELPYEFIWQELLYPTDNKTQLDAIPAVAEINRRLTKITQTLAEGSTMPLLLGGDHSSAIGYWGGIYHAKQNAPLGLIWIDAHMDSHTPETTDTGNVHGMPLAVLLGHGHPDLISVMPDPIIAPENVCLIGVRSYESGEAALLERLNVRVFFMEEINERGVDAVFSDALNIVNKNTMGYGISLDLDAIDPIDAPGVGNPVPNGIRSVDLLQCFNQCRVMDKLIGLEIAEFNPEIDKEHKTEQLIADIVDSIMKG